MFQSISGYLTRYLCLVFLSFFGGLALEPSSRRQLVSIMVAGSYT